MRYVRLFYDKNKTDFMDERISEYGAGFVWRRKLDSLNDIFRPNKKSSAPQDTTKTKTYDENTK